MIVGLGVDIVELPRIARAYSRFGDAFCARILTSFEVVHLPAAPIAFLASRFAAKEAAVKALGTGFSRGISMHDVEVRSAPSGRPELFFLNAAQQRAEELHVSRTIISLTHGRESAVAVVVLEQ